MRLGFSATSSMWIGLWEGGERALLIDGASRKKEETGVFLAKGKKEN